MTDNDQSHADRLAELFRDDNLPEPTALDRALKREFGDEWFLRPDGGATIRQVARLTLALPKSDTNLIERVVTAQQLVAAVSKPSDVTEGMEMVQYTCQRIALPDEEPMPDRSDLDGTARFVTGLARIEQHSTPGEFTLQPQEDTDRSLPEDLPERIPRLGEATEAAYALINAHSENGEIRLSLSDLCEMLAGSGYTDAEIDKALSNVQRSGYVHVSADGDFRY